MTTQSGIIVEAPHELFKVSSGIARPTPSGREVLVKTLTVGLNPVEPFQQHTGVLVDEWPAVLGSDFAGVVVDVGPDCSKLRPGDYVHGCASIGRNKYTPFQETFLADETTVLRKVSGLNAASAATVGSGLLTAALCLLAGTGLKLPKAGSKSPEKDEWIVVLGGSGTVGQFAVQIAHQCGYKVLASSSLSKTYLPAKNGATATFNNRAPIDEQVAAIKERTGGGKFARIFDTTAQGYELMLQALEGASTLDTKKYLASVDDWSDFNTPAAFHEYRAELGQLGRLQSPLGVEVTTAIASWIPDFEAHLEAGSLVPLEYDLAPGAGWEQVIASLGDLESGKSAKKIVVKIRDQ
ncbi:hypothetical protein VTK73DRAFT_9568 [Phialemonium thermophilum]|uniref:Enoyl reductase (ER) domain-containing protein n=1 Tax=Phialemonium thermophilum TaxID=223376 RepID=A0ABR3W1P7_9PEZI